MSSIPTGLGSSIVGGTSAANRQAEAKNKESADQAKATDNASFADRLQNVIDTADGDKQVNPDGEGAGSQGRPFSESPEEQQPDEATEEPPESEGGLDIQA